MPVDPSDPEVFEEEDDAVELAEETPEADAAEQRTDVRQEHDDTFADADTDAANVADVAEQARVVTIDEDDYR
ncbi:MULTISPECIES: hypothetical protein [unclassified Streptomyces]|uniref:DNA primase n=1 Tax=Streptomyces sp. NBC_00060 TaxID=2975636 RepID=A0AAU2GXB4_9ACTN